jgi:hypothetical protein
MIPYSQGATKYHRKALERGADPEKQELATAHVAQYMQDIRAFMIAVKVRLQSLGVPFYTYMSALNYARRVYGFCRKYPKDLLMTARPRRRCRGWHAG